MAGLAAADAELTGVERASDYHSWNGAGFHADEQGLFSCRRDWQRHGCGKERENILCRSCQPLQSNHHHASNVWFGQRVVLPFSADPFSLSFRDFLVISRPRVMRHSISHFWSTGAVFVGMACHLDILYEAAHHCDGNRNPVPCCIRWIKFLFHGRKDRRVSTPIVM